MPKTHTLTYNTKKKQSLVPQFDCKKTQTDPVQEGAKTSNIILIKPQFNRQEIEQNKLILTWFQPESENLINSEHSSRPRINLN